MTLRHPRSIVALTLLALIDPFAFAQPATPKAAPTPAPAIDPAEAGADPQTIKLLNYLEQEYGVLLAKNKDRVSRSLIAICYNRIPRASVTKLLLDMTKKEPDALVRAVAWECLLSRIPDLNHAQYLQLMEATGSLIQSDILRGKLRVAALELMTYSPPNRRNKELFVQIYARCDSRLPADDEVLDSLGRCLGTWRSPDLVEHLIGRLQNIDEAFRAYRVLYAAGCKVEPSTIDIKLGDRNCLKQLSSDCIAWWNQEGANWKEPKVSTEDGLWKAVGPHFIFSPPALSSINPQDKSWRHDLELRPPALKSFDVGFVVDVTGSMDPALAWLQRDVRAMMNGIGVVALEPRVGITFYRDQGDAFVTRNTPLTNNANVLMKALAAMDCKGGGDVEEAVLDGITESLRNNPWASTTNSRKVMVLVADAPAHPQDQKACEDLIASAAEKGMRLYALKLQSPNTAANVGNLDAIATAGKGASLTATALEIKEAQLRISPVAGLSRARPIIPSLPTPGDPSLTKGAAPAPARPAGFSLGGSAPDPARLQADLRANRIEALERDPNTPFVPATGPVGRRVLASILVDAINPQFADRVEPMAAILWELLQDPSTEKQPPFGPVAKVDTSHIRNDATMIRNDSKVKPKGPQDR